MVSNKNNTLKKISRNKNNYNYFKNNIPSKNNIKTKKNFQQRHKYGGSNETVPAVREDGDPLREGPQVGQEVVEEKPESADSGSANLEPGSVEPESVNLGPKEVGSVSGQEPVESEELVGARKMAEETESKAKKLEQEAEKIPDDQTEEKQKATDAASKAREEASAAKEKVTALEKNPSEVSEPTKEEVAAPAAAPAATPPETMTKNKSGNEGSNNGNEGSNNGNKGSSDGDEGSGDGDEGSGDGSKGSSKLLERIKKIEQYLGVPTDDDECQNVTLLPENDWNGEKQSELNKNRTEKIKNFLRILCLLPEDKTSSFSFLKNPESKGNDNPVSYDWVPNPDDAAKIATNSHLLNQRLFLLSAIPLNNNEKQLFEQLFTNYNTNGLVGDQFKKAFGIYTGAEKPEEPTQDNLSGPAEETDLGGEDPQVESSGKISSSPPGKKVPKKESDASQEKIEVEKKLQEDIEIKDLLSTISRAEKLKIDSVKIYNAKERLKEMQKGLEPRVTKAREAAIKAAKGKSESTQQNASDAAAEAILNGGTDAEAVAAAAAASEEEDVGTPDEDAPVEDPELTKARQKAEEAQQEVEELQDIAQKKQGNEEEFSKATEAVAAATVKEKELREKVLVLEQGTGEGVGKKGTPGAATDKV